MHCCLSDIEDLSMAALYYRITCVMYVKLSLRSMQWNTENGVIFST